MTHDQKVPNWKSDFPIDQEEATHVSRREFAKFLCLLSGAMALGNGLIVLKAYAYPEEGLKGEFFICNESEVPVQGMKLFVIQGRLEVPYLLIRLAEDEWRAFEQKCTHLSCSVRYRPDLGKIECPCHHGFFDARTGTVLQGPPPRPLPQLSVLVKDGRVYVTEFKEDPSNAFRHE
jgi:Rieske Fe-S protein